MKELIIQAAVAGKSIVKAVSSDSSILATPGWHCNILTAWPCDAWIWPHIPVPCRADLAEFAQNHFVKTGKALETGAHIGNFSADNLRIWTGTYTYVYLYIKLLISI